MLPMSMALSGGVPPVRWVFALLITGMCFGCGKEINPPVEILHTRFGVLNIGTDDKVRFQESKVISLVTGQRYGWAIYLRTNKEKISYTEKITLSAPTTWGMKGDIRYEISPDKKSILVYREITMKEGQTKSLFGAWGVSADDPAGKGSIEITVEGKVIHQFDFELKKP